MQSKILFLILALAIGSAAYAAPPVSRVKAAAGQSAGGHSTALSWTLSADDTTTACVTGANCLQNVYRASGSCSSSSSFTLLTGTALNATATGYTDTTVTPGNWCYGVTFGINGLESAKDTVTVSLQPASPGNLVGAPK